MLELTGFLGLTRISFFLLTQIPLYCFVGGKSHRWFCVWAGSCGFRFAFGLTRISLFGLTRISQIPQYRFVGGKSHRWFCVCGLVWAPMGAHCSRSHGLIFWTLRTNQTLRTNWTFLKIIREICGICVRPPWDWDLCEASVDSVGAGDKITKNCVIWGAFWKIWKKSVEKVATLRIFCKLCVLIIKKCVGLLFFLPLF